MIALKFSVQKPVRYIMTGKFKAPAPDWIHLTRVLSDFELIIMTEGVLHLSLDQNKYILRAHDFLLCPPFAHQAGVESSLCSFYWLHFMPVDIEEGFSTSTFPPQEVNRDPASLTLPMQGTLPSLDKIIVMMKQLQDAIRSYPDSVYHDYLASAILLEFSNECREARLGTGLDVLQQQLFNDIIDYIKWNLASNIRVGDIACYFGYNPKYLSHMFSEMMGQSLKQYIIQKKIEHAKFILSDTNDPIHKIAESLGYNDHHNFMKLFKKHVGLTPTEYRNAYNKRLLFYV